MIFTAFKKIQSSSEAAFDYQGDENSELKECIIYKTEYYVASDIQQYFFSL